MATTAKKNIPALRFPGFKGEWTEKTLGDIAIFSKGKGVSKSDIIENGKYECIRYGELYTDYSEVIKEIKSRTNLPKEELIFSEYNDVIIPASGETQIDIATASCVLKKDVALGGDLNIIKTDENGIILAYYLNSKKKLEIAALAQGNSVVHLYAKQLKTLSLSLPSIPEQQKIASFLSSVDERLQQLQQQQSLLEQYKKGCMQQLFGQKLQFKNNKEDDSSKWKTAKLGEIGSFQTSSIDKLSKENEEAVFLINYMNVYKHEQITNSTKEKLQIVTANSKQIESCNLKKGDILFTPSSETPSDIGHSVVIFEDLDKCVYSYHVMRFRPNIKLDILYSHYFCNTSDVLAQFTKLATGSTRFTLSLKSFESIEIQLPSLEEQTKIAKFLSAIDEQINTVKQQIIQTQQFKKGLLQQLFV